MTAMRLKGRLEFVRYVAPFAVWIALQSILPQTAWAYAVRSAATLAALVACWRGTGKSRAGSPRSDKRLPCVLAVGLAVGVFVAAFWILPEGCEWYRRWILWPFGAATPAEAGASPYDPAVCGWALTLAKLAGSAFVIAPAEELFFRSFLYRWVRRGAEWREAKVSEWDWNAVLWTAFVFSLEHSPRFAVAALCAVAYQYAAAKAGLVGAIVAHVATNLILAVYVIAAGEWGFW